MDIFLIVRREKRTIFLDVKEDTTIDELKRMLEGIIKIKPCDQRLFTQDEETMEDDKLLTDYNITVSSAKAHSPAQLSLAIRKETGEFTPIEFSPYTTPPPLPEILQKPEAVNAKEQVA